MDCTNVLWRRDTGGAYDAEAKSPENICRTSCSRAPRRRNGDQANGTRKAKESCGRCVSWQRPARNAVEKYRARFHDFEVQHPCAGGHRCVWWRSLAIGRHWLVFFKDTWLRRLASSRHFRFCTKGQQRVSLGRHPRRICNRVIQEHPPMFF